MTQSKKINVLIPLGGAGVRFSSVGYKKPKPFIDVDGESMIRTVISNLRHENSHFIFVINKNIVSVDDFSNHISDLDISREIHSTDGLTDGPASTVLVAKDSIDNQTPLIVVNCDQVILDFDLDKLSEFALVNNCDGLLGCFLSSSKKNSYVKLDPNGEICEVKEKIVISNVATNGLHYWREGRYFIDSAKEMIDCNDRYNNEFYVAPSYNYLIKNGKRILPFFYNLHFPIGTPDDLDYYLKIKGKKNEGL